MKENFYVKKYLIFETFKNGFMKYLSHAKIINHDMHKFTYKIKSTMYPDTIL